MTLEEHAKRYPEVWRKFSPRQTLIRYAWYAGIVFIAVWSIHQLEIPWIYFLDAHVQTETCWFACSRLTGRFSKK
jgi:hypothetical protein